MLFLSLHAVGRIRERGISRDEVVEALYQGRETVYPSADDPDCSVVLGSTSAGRRLKIVVQTDDQNYIVTAADRDAE